jgi:hypothetical protein
MNEDFFNDMMEEIFFKPSGRSIANDSGIPVNKYSLTCEYCGSVSFIAGPDGHIYCQQCALAYKYDNAFEDWIYTTANPDAYLKMKENKEWSKNHQEYLTPEQIQNKKPVKLTKEQIEREIDKAETNMKKEGRFKDNKNKKSINKNKKDNNNE